MTESDGQERHAASGAQETAVQNRYATAAQDLAPALCCPADYDPRYLEIIPDEITGCDGVTIVGG